MKRTRKDSGFTLIELLVVIGIIAVLVGLLLPAVIYVMRKWDRMQAQMDAQMIKTAIQSFQNDYGKLPSASQGSDVLAEGSESANIIRILMGENPALNPRNTAYLESKGDANSNVNLPDPWDRQYGIKMDLNSDGIITFKGIRYKTAVIVVSGGPDETIDERSRSSEAGSDDIHSSQ